VLRRSGTSIRHFEESAAADDEKSLSCFDFNHLSDMKLENHNPVPAHHKPSQDRPNLYGAA
jgi:hypothetical protein